MMCASRYKITLIAFLAAGFLALIVINCASHSRQHSSKPHHTDHGFRNVFPYERPSFMDFIKWRWGRIWKDIPSPEDYDFQRADNDPEFIRKNRVQVTVTWIGHATLLLQLEGRNILTDPHFSDRASPVQWAGPKRVAAPGIDLDQLPPIDIVVISHDHYDSLDETTIKRLSERSGGGGTKFYVPLGLKDWFLERGIRQVHEMDWWDTVQDGPLEIIAVPVQHWSKRSLFSRNQSLWAGWVIRAREFNFFFAGDSGYTPHFREVGEKLGPFDLAAIPIGAYEPRWFMRSHHMNPEEAVQVHLDVKSKKSVAMHWGTFILTDEPLEEPPERLKTARRERDLSEQEFMILRHGETVILDAEPR